MCEVLIDPKVPKCETLANIKIKKNIIKEMSEEGMGGCRVPRRLDDYRSGEELFERR